MRARQALFVLSSLLLARPAGAQNLGHKFLGGLGLRAGSVPPAGLYVADRLSYYTARQVRDRSGARIPLALSLEAVANGLGLMGAVEIPFLRATYSATVAVPLASLEVTSDRFELGLDKFGLGDLYVMPLELGWELAPAQVVVSYAFYAPTGAFQPRAVRGGVGSGHWSHELSLGGTLVFGGGAWDVSALGSLEVNRTNRAIDVTRGATIQVHGGIGRTLFEAVEVGLVGYAQWQITDDSGADIPPVLRGARERDFALGPEVDLFIPPLHGAMVLRMEWEVDVHARPQGMLLVLALSGGLAP